MLVSLPLFFILWESNVLHLLVVTFPNVYFYLQVSVKLMNPYYKKVLKGIGKMVQLLYVFGSWDKWL